MRGNEGLVRAFAYTNTTDNCWSIMCSSLLSYELTWAFLASLLRCLIFNIEKEISIKQSERKIWTRRNRKGMSRHRNAMRKVSLCDDGKRFKRSDRLFVDVNFFRVLKIMTTIWPPRMTITTESRQAPVSDRFLCLLTSVKF